MKSLLLITIMCFSFIPVFSQSRRISGTVTGQDTASLNGATITIKGTTRSAVSDANGAFTIDVTGSNANTLTVTYVGYQPRDIDIKNQSVINVTLQKEDAALDAVVVVGYGTQKRKDVTGSIASVSQERLNNLPNSNFAQALQGSVPGVSINTNGGGAEGNNVTILIRGQKSINGSRSPLIILDGIPYSGSISDINPTDIASIDILKDASASAIYGARSANGVILLTTKKGSTGKPVISYDGFAGTMQYANLPDILMGDDFYNFKLTREPASITLSEKAFYESKNYTNWLDLTTRTGKRSQHTLGIRGGSNNFKYYTSVTLLDVKGIAVNDDFKRLSSRINLEATITNWLSFGTNTQLSYNDRSGLAPTFSGDYGAYLFNPLTTPFDSLGKPTIYPWPEDVFFENPLAPTLASNRDNTYKIFTTNYMQVKFPFVEGLSYRLNTGVEYEGRNINTYYGRNTRRGVLAKGILTQGNRTLRNYTLENILTYDRTFKKHTIGFTGLYSYQESVERGDTLAAENFPNDVLTFYQANVALLVKPSAYLGKETFLSQMARINYNYDSRYLLTLTARRDGYSGFGEDKKFGFFPSVAVGWNITNEKFFADNKTLTNLKLRISYGSNGNTAVSPFQTLARLSTRSYVDGSTTAAGYVPTSFSNPLLHWETSTTANVGFDFGFWKNRIQGTIDYYKTNTHDLLLNRSVSSVQGIDRVTQNIGKTSNQGFELGITTTNFKTKNFTWTSNANFTINRNKIVDLYGDGKSDTLNRWFIGMPIDVSFDYVYNGVWQLTDDTSKTPQGVVRPGDAKISDINGDKIINAFDRTIIGNLQPDFIWGLANTFRYKNLTLYAFVHGVQGRHQANGFLADNVNSGVRYTTVAKNWWRPDNPTNDFYANRLNTNPRGANIVQNSSFIRVKDISLTYEFNGRLLEKTKLSRLRVYVETRNPFTFTQWTGLDPEFTSQQTVPLQREYSVGLNVSL
ncbi:MAG: TonB-dependent receptor [Segetibacter sp.]|nr:TonB-dependent receptor [Segetibacter sp.]